MIMIMNMCTLIRIRSRDVAIDMYKFAINIGVLQLEFAWAMRYAGYTRARWCTRARRRAPPRGSKRASKPVRRANLTEATTQALAPCAGQAVVRQNR